MKLFDYETYEDFGKEWFFQVLRFQKFALLDITVQWDDYGLDSILPEFSLCISSGFLLGFFIRYKRFQFDLDVVTARPRDLSWYRRNSDDN
jgi:hypothetical protein